jgi:hypothetical protein
VKPLTVSLGEEQSLLSRQPEIAAV